MDGWGGVAPSFGGLLLLIVDLNSPNIYHLNLTPKNKKKQKKNSQRNSLVCFESTPCIHEHPPLLEKKKGRDIYFYTYNKWHDILSSLK